MKNNMLSNKTYLKISSEIKERIQSDKYVNAIMQKIEKGTATIKDAETYAQICSHFLSDCLSSSILTAIEPGEKELICKQLLLDHYNDVNDVFHDVQILEDERIGIYLNPIKPKFPNDRVNNLAHSLEDPTVPVDTIIRRADAPVENTAYSFYIDYIKENAKLREKAGLKCYIVRDAGGGCCDWCAALAGRYDYASAPEDVFHKHDKCTCTLTYECGRMRQNVWNHNQKWEVSPEELEQRKEISEASKPTMNTPEQAKELERQALRRIRFHK